MSYYQLRIYSFDSLNLNLLKERDSMLNLKLYKSDCERIYTIGAHMKSKENVC